MTPSSPLNQAPESKEWSEDLAVRFDDEFPVTDTHHFGWGIEPEKTRKILAFIQSEISKARSEAQREIWENLKPKFKLCEGNHPSPFTDNWICKTCLHNEGYNEATGKLKDLIKI